MDRNPPTLFDPEGRRLYLTRQEREAFMQAATTAARPVRTFCGVLHFTGCRISEALELTPQRVDLAAETVTFRTLKKRGKTVWRAVPVPPDFLDVLDMVHGIREARREQRGTNGPLWGYSRTTAWRRVRETMTAAELEDGPHLCPKGLRHGFGIAAIASGVPLNILQKWLGHANMETTAIYANALGDEQKQLAARMWAN